MRILRLAALAVIAGVFSFGVFKAARERARKSRPVRRWIMASTGTAGAIALFLVSWVPYHLPTGNSAAGIVILLVTWIVGGSMIALCAASFLGAATAPSDGGAPE